MSASRRKQEAARMNGFDDEFRGDALIDLVVAIEAAIGCRSAGMTPLGRAVTDLCEEAIKKDATNVPA